MKCRRRIEGMAISIGAEQYRIKICLNTGYRIAISLSIDVPPWWTNYYWAMIECFTTLDTFVE
jgi:hypothetical protein